MVKLLQQRNTLPLRFFNVLLLVLLFVNDAYVFCVDDFGFFIKFVSNSCFIESVTL